MKFKLLLTSLCFVFLLSNQVFASCSMHLTQEQMLAQADLSPLDTLILDLQDVKELIESGDNKTAITILKSALKQVRKVKEFNKETKLTTSKRIKKGIKLLQNNENQEALDLLEIGFDALEEAGFISS